jgi:FAD/FMN-containing dehydrogenase
VVLANGTVVQANEKENPELLVALRGGAANFGIITRVNFRAFEQGPIWGGTVYCALDTGKGAAVVNSVVYTKAEECPAVFEPIMKIPSMFSTMRLASMHEMSLEQGSFAPNGKRYAFCP